MRNRIYVLILLLLSAGTYLGNAFHPPLLDDADASHAVVAREMMERHNYVTLYMDGIRYLSKAPLHYWMVAAAYKLFGVNEFSTRLPVVLAMIGLVLMCFEFGRRFFSSRAGFYAGLAVASSFGYFLFTRIMIPEAIYSLFFTAAFYLFLRAWYGHLEKKAYWGCAALIALSVLTRGLVGVVFPVGVIGVFLLGFFLQSRDWKKIRGLPWLSSMLIFLGIAVPWHVLAEHQSPGFYWSYFVNEHWKRALGTRYPHDYSAVPLWLWLAGHIAWFFPWIVFAPLTIIAAGRACRVAKSAAKLPAKFAASSREDYRWSTLQWSHIQWCSILFLLCWVFVIMGFFCVESGSRMEYYAFSCWPGVALLLGVGLAACEEKERRWTLALQALLCVLGVTAAVVLFSLVHEARLRAATGDLASSLQTHSDSVYRLSLGHLLDLTPGSFRNLSGPALMAAWTLLLGTMAAFLLRWRRFPAASATALATAMCLFFFAANWAYGKFTPVLSSYPFAQQINQYLQPQDIIAFYGEFDAGSSISFYTDRQIFLVNGRYNNLEYGSYFPDAAHVFWIDSDLRERWNADSRVFLFVPGDKKQESAPLIRQLNPWILGREGEDTLYVNHPLFPGEKQTNALPSQ